VPKSIFEYLDRLGETKIDFTFERSVQLNEIFYKKLPVIEICGTNGKGSTTAFLEKILIQSGYRVGAYTSPHLEKINERIRIQGENISDELMEKHGASVCAELERHGIQPTYFEFLTFLGLHVFEQENIDVAIFEAGLGGRKDSIHAIPRIGAILTSISYDHMDYLGNTLLQIAKEKVPVLEKSPFAVAAKQDSEVEEYIVSTLKQSHTIEGRDFQHSGSFEKFFFVQDDFEIGPIRLGLHGDYQSSNASLAISMALHLRKIQWNISNEAIELGIQTARNNGRLEQWKNSLGNTIWLDVAHNPDAIQFLVQHFFVRKQRGFQTVFACSNDKPWDEMIETLRTITQDFHFVSTPSLKSWKPDFALENPVECIQKLMNGSSSPILCTGSFYHVGEIRKKLPEFGFAMVE
jgi:dihydrofolate synthase/folylpolyglutamate synthase